MNSDLDPSLMFFAKATRVAEAAVRRAALPQNRQDLRQHLGYIRAEQRRRRDVLGGMGASISGFRYYFCTLGADSGEADLLALALAHMIERCDA